MRKKCSWYFWNWSLGNEAQGDRLAPVLFNLYWGTKQSGRGGRRCKERSTAMGVFTLLTAQCGAAPCLLTAKDKGFANIYGHDDVMAGGPLTRCEFYCDRARMATAHGPGIPANTPAPLQGLM